MVFVYPRARINHNDQSSCGKKMTVNSSKFLQETDIKAQTLTSLQISSGSMQNLKTEL